MLADTSPQRLQTTAGASNADFQWATFDSEAYFQHYYGDPHADDDRVICCAVEAMKRIAPASGHLDIVDIGTGPNLIPFFCALPFARTLTVWEYAESNIAWLENELRCKTLRAQWKHFWDVTRAAYGPAWRLPDQPAPAIAAITTLTRGSVFDLPQCRWDAATMFFCAESITERQDEFEAAVAAYAKCVKPGGALAAAFLVRSGGYEVSGRRFPVLHLTSDTIEAAFARHATDVSCEHIGIVEREIRSGYSGFVFLTGRAAAV